MYEGGHSPRLQLLQLFGPFFLKDRVSSSPGWFPTFYIPNTSWSFHLPTSDSWVLEIQIYTTMQVLCHAGDQAQGFIHARQILYQLSHTSIPVMSFSIQYFYPSLPRITMCMFGHEPTPRKTQFYCYPKKFDYMSQLRLKLQEFYL